MPSSAATPPALDQEGDLQMGSAPTLATQVPPDAALPLDAEHLHQERAPVEDAEMPEVPLFDEFRLKIYNSFLKLGMDIDIRETKPDSWKPDSTCDDYLTDHRDLEKFWGCQLTSTLQEADLRHRRKLALLLVHPDKHHSLPEEHKAWATGLARDIIHFSQEVMDRVGRYKSRVIREPSRREYSFQFQELPEDFHAF